MRHLRTEIRERLQAELAGEARLHVLVAFEELADLTKRRPHSPEFGIGWIEDALRLAPDWMWQDLLACRPPAPYYQFLV